MDAYNYFGAGTAIVLLAIWVGLLVFFIAGLVSIIKSRNWSPGLKALWVLAIFTAPFLGPLFWFVWGNKEGNLLPPG